MIADERERTEALDPSRSFIVQAPAGSGKTALLVQRYLNLLATVEKPESVVAMTFTRKAAAELKERIHDAFQAVHRGDTPQSDHEQKTFELAAAVLKQDARYGWNLLSDTTRLQIQTIDSLCAALTRQMPVVSGFGGFARVVEDATELYHRAARETLREMAEGNGTDRLLLARIGVYFDSDFVSLENQIVGMLARRDQWRFAVEEADQPVAGFCKLLERAQRALVNVFRTQGTVDFTAITQAAIAVLGTPDQPSDLLYGLDYRIQHLLVDEFQDTSYSQYELINALTAQWSDGDGHTLFLVGDPMQSIYGFRGAEVSLFLKSWHDEALKSVRLHRISLSTNFRCTPEILSWVIKHFEPIMSEDTGGAVQFRGSEASRVEGGVIPELTALIDDKTGDKEAVVVAKRAKAALQRGSVAILVRSRNHLLSILPALRQEGVPYEAVEIAKLADQQHVEDVISLTRALLHTGERLSWLACLRAPWCGLSLTDLSLLAEEERERNIPELLLDPAKIGSLSVESRWRIARTGEILLNALAKVGRVPLRGLLEDTWLLLGGPAILRDAHEADDIRTYLNLVGEMEQGGVIRDFSLLAQRMEFLFAKPASGAGYVQVMTVHQAKGLEFDTVIIPQLGGSARLSERDLLAWNEDVDGDGRVTLTVAAQPRKGEKAEKYDTIRKMQAAKELHELKRLFYVGCTRARNELYLVGSAKTAKNGSDLQKPWSTSFLRLIWGSVTADFEGALRGSPVQRSLFDEVSPVRRTILRRLPADWRSPQFADSVEWGPSYVRAVASSRDRTYEWVSDTARHVGTVTHEILKRISATAKAAEFEGLIKTELRRLGVPEAEETGAAERVLRAIKTTLASDRGRWILGDHPNSHREWPIGGRIGDQLVSGTVDRLFRDEEGRLWIIDFKTSEHQGGKLERFLDEEQRRYHEQLENYATLLWRIEAGPIHLGLYFPLLDAWREWAFAESSALVAH
jgi:ATP-dependent exoDNAse (exonuclease V) beta subunit